MIEISQIPATSQLKELRGKINTMANEINDNQLVIGQIANPIATIVFLDDTQPLEVRQFDLNSLFAVCMPAPNGVYVAQVFGGLVAKFTGDINANAIKGVYIYIPAVLLPSRGNEVPDFLTPDSQGFIVRQNETVNTGLQVTIFAKGSTNSTSITTDASLYVNNSTPVVLNRQLLQTSDTGSTVVYLYHDKLSIYS
nr:MAG TPA: hypothetical protein [Caudoviricetes sp.]